MIGFRLLVKRKQVFVVQDLDTSDIDGVQNSVYGLREDLCSALPGLPDSALAIGEKIVNECTSYLGAALHREGPECPVTIM